MMCAHPVSQIDKYKMRFKIIILKIAIFLKDNCSEYVSTTSITIFLGTQSSLYQTHAVYDTLRLERQNSR